MAYDIPTANVSLKPSLPKYIITTDRVPVTTNTTASAQIFRIKKQKNTQLQAVLQHKPAVVYVISYKYFIIKHELLTQIEFQPFTITTMLRNKIQIISHCKIMAASTKKMVCAGSLQNLPVVLYRMQNMNRIRSNVIVIHHR